jgi:NAD(P)-dependent dehydrogenase (short-subunit alcohol dehydrogenase family)
MLDPELSGLGAIVTGGASGIGLAVAQLLAERGATVACLDLSGTVPEPLIGIACDVTSDDQVSRAVDSAAGHLGRVDILVNNAGIGAQGAVTDNDIDEWARVFDVNVFGLVRVTQAALPHLRASEHAAIVNTCSIAATAGVQNRVLYSASKGAVYSITLAMATDHLQEIRVNCVLPGTADTPWISRLLAAADDPEAELAALNARQPIGRLVTAREVAAAIVYLASPAAGSTTGSALPVDGGFGSLRPRPVAAT